MRKLSQIILSFFLCLMVIFGSNSSPAQATGVYDLPVINAGDQVWLIDSAEVISRATESKLENQLSNLAQQTGNEVRMVVINRLDYGETIETLAEQIFTKWYPNPEEQANQTVLVLDTLTNRSAIYSGPESQTLLTDEISDSIVNETLVVSLKDLQYNQALIDASTRLVAVLSGQEDPGPPAIPELNIEGTFTTAEETDDRSATIWVIVLLFFATLIPMVTYFWYVGLPGR
jgi:uncharacterized protein